MKIIENFLEDPRIQVELKKSTSARSAVVSLPINLPESTFVRIIDLRKSRSVGNIIFVK